MANERSATAVGRAVLRTQSDDRLIRLTREGHDSAYEEIVRRYRSRLVRQAAAIVPPHRAEDVVQESLARALPAMRANDTEIALGAWLATIVRNRSLNDLRDEHGPHEQLDDQYDGVPQPPTVAAQRQEIRDVVLAIGALPEQQRRALVGRELEGRSHEEIADELGITAGSARGLIYRARIAVRDSLGAIVPVPAVRMLLETGGGEASAAVAGAGAAVAGSSGGMKAAVGVLAVLATVGSGVAIERRLGDRDGNGAEGVARADAAEPGRESGDGSRDPAPSGSGSAPGGDDADGSGDGGRDDGDGRDGPDRDGGDDSSGPGEGNRQEDDDHSGPGGGGDEDEPEEEEEDRSEGSGHSGSGGGRSGSGGGDNEPEEPEEPEEDNSGPGNGGDPEGDGADDEPVGE
jgi:RNA polymerase sigma factor (sigma-70 family)